MSNVATWPTTAETWLDERGKGAWIAAMILGFIFFWPVGLALLAYMIWSKRMFSKSHNCHGRGISRSERHGARMARRHGFRSSGNTAFDAYKADTLNRLMDEQQNFEAFLERLRAAKDKSEFDEFMDERSHAAKEARETTSDDDDVEDVESAKA
ncbi:MAG: DUF2852 domain-containing protein [Rhodobacteraceae bacterium]|nr:DUF2852 domain-containing protein [Paracoccaceae bacterium]